jgi:hypothetical protein
VRGDRSEQRGDEGETGQDLFKKHMTCDDGQAWREPHRELREIRVTEGRLFTPSSRVRDRCHLTPARHSPDENT